MSNKKEEHDMADAYEEAEKKAAAEAMDKWAAEDDEEEGKK